MSNRIQACICNTDPRIHGLMWNVDGMGEFVNFTTDAKFVTKSALVRFNEMLMKGSTQKFTQSNKTHDWF